jgi:hypothetical protein
MSTPYASTVEHRLEQLREDYRCLLEGGQPISLHALLSTPELDVARYAQGLRRHKDADAAEAEIKRFCQEYQIWIEKGGDAYNSMTAYFHPVTADVPRLVLIGIYYAILYYINDMIGRERLGNFSSEEKEEVYELARHVFALIRTRETRPQPTWLEQSFVAFMRQLEKNAPPDWMERFLHFTLLHLQPALQEQNARGLGYVLSVDEYIDRRLHISGMYPALMMGEYGRNYYLNWELLEKLDLSWPLRRLQILTAAIGAFMNDIFSFEKEFIRDRSDFNLVVSIYLNHPELMLEQAIDEAARIVKQDMQEFETLREQVEARCAEVAADYPELVRTVQMNIEDLIASVRATWMWQNVTARYSKRQSIFIETSGVSEQAVRRHG